MNRQKLLQQTIGLLLATLFLAECGPPQATLTPDRVATSVAEAKAIAATLTAEFPTAVPTPTHTPGTTHTPPSTSPPIDTATPAPEPTPTSVPTDVEEIVLLQAAQQVCHLPGETNVPEIYTTDAVYSFVCAPAAGHSTSAGMERFSSQVEAQAAFNSMREDNPVKDFHGFPVSVWNEQHPSFPDGRSEYRIWVWLADRWLINVRAFDDTYHINAPDPEIVSEAIYQAATEYDLFSIPDE